ncbi:hypothetical protein [Candidatus Cyanaurora vandensis]|uniref:hypothetical protein n=1 Tax=Candidatus Cyanaurora vandensis TaxID=2714958 RepID=UPI00257B797F|nr:hypothetical protein [Candidatus Cyanaurora vandensis]
MLILTGEQVELCSVLMNGATVTGIEYLHKLYAPLGEYPQDEYIRALKYCREMLDKGIFCLVVREAHRISLWTAGKDLRKSAVTGATYRGTETTSSVHLPSAAKLQPAMYRGQRVRPVIDR